MNTYEDIFGDLDRQTLLKHHNEKNKKSKVEHEYNLDIDIRSLVTSILILAVLLLCIIATIKLYDENDEWIITLSASIISFVLAGIILSSFVKKDIVYKDAERRLPSNFVPFKRKRRLTRSQV